MYTAHTFVIAVILMITISQVVSQSCVANYSRVNQNQLVYSTSSTLITFDSSTLYPPLGLGDSAYLLPSSCLGLYGPLGPYGPLGMLGPLGSNVWNPSYWISGSGLDWSQWSKNLTGMGGPLSQAGPLGNTGPLSPYWYNQVCPCINAFSHQLMLGGVFSVLGPLGPLGAVGPLGPLGPIGAHGYTQDSYGQYVDGAGNVQRSVVVPFDKSTSRTYSLYEEYDQDFAAAKTDNDCSFYVEGVWKRGEDSRNTFTFTCNNEYVTVLVVPLMLADDFDLLVTSPTTMKGSTSTYVDWAHFKVKAKQPITVKVNLGASANFLQSTYRLYVTGSTSYLNQRDITGNHLVVYG
eukprot:TRINITY_DN8354_c0_g1_i1.p1 TRINITY_DN8354_c0_g1~~TRINITY_DN8354_c0_g1_i1.p1  ORF type:complete len:348 (+),score=52.68 TRINITY_DN8354_c0_g1_i1:25-1068(+)